MAYCRQRRLSVAAFALRSTHYFCHYVRHPLRSIGMAAKVKSTRGGDGADEPGTGPIVSETIGNVRTVAASARNKRLWILNSHCWARKLSFEARVHWPEHLDGLSSAATFLLLGGDFYVAKNCSRKLIELECLRLETQVRGAWWCRHDDTEGSLRGQYRAMCAFDALRSCLYSGE